jgi:hypothetical protein
MEIGWGGEEYCTDDMHIFAPLLATAVENPMTVYSGTYVHGLQLSADIAIFRVNGNDNCVVSETFGNLAYSSGGITENRGNTLDSSREP